MQSSNKLYFFVIYCELILVIVSYRDCLVFFIWQIGLDKIGEIIKSVDVVYNVEICVNCFMYFGVQIIILIIELKKNKM